MMTHEQACAEVCRRFCSADGTAHDDVCVALAEVCNAPPGNLCTDTGCWDMDRCVVRRP